MQRIEEKQGKARGAILLTELIKVEQLGEDDSSASHHNNDGGNDGGNGGNGGVSRSWFDTKVVNGFHQRFDRRHLAQFLRDELKREMGVSRRSNEESKKAADLIRDQRNNDEGGEDGGDGGKREESDRQQLKRERERAKRMVDKEHKEHKKHHKQHGKQHGKSDDDDGNDGNDGNDGVVKKWPRFGTKEDGHEAEDSVRETTVQSQELLHRLKGKDRDQDREKDREMNREKDSPSTSDLPPDMFAAGLDDEGASFFWCFLVFLVFFALFIDLLTDQVQPLF